MQPETDTHGACGAPTERAIEKLDAFTLQKTPAVRILEALGSSADGICGFTLEMNDPSFGYLTLRRLVVGHSQVDGLEQRLKVERFRLVFEDGAEPASPNATQAGGSAG
jgi:hypothetical protein